MIRITSEVVQISNGIPELQIKCYELQLQSYMRLELAASCTNSCILIINIFEKKNCIDLPHLFLVQNGQAAIDTAL